MRKEPRKLITCILPDDGNDKLLIKALYKEKNITQAESVNCLGMDIYANASVKSGTLPEAYLARQVLVVVPEDQAEDLFNYIYDKANIARPGGGVIFQGALSHCTGYSLPEKVEEEQ